MNRLKNLSMIRNFRNSQNAIHHDFFAHQKLYYQGKPYLVITQQDTCVAKSYGLPHISACSAWSNFM